jgi:hypothetical protein
VKRKDAALALQIPAGGAREVGVRSQLSGHHIQ